LLPAAVLEDLAPGYIMRPMARSDKNKGFLEVLRGTGKVGYVSNNRWDERCEYLYKRAEQGDEYILVIVDMAADKVVGVGRWAAERGLYNIPTQSW
jgi:glucosamine-phosphate N-acetyltransferase